ncbi:MAG TPA: hypothetical protein IAC31_01550 [Candidatus Faecousia intestinigallinarum]|nr:hypothetical protein [Candidatus Faecousia intestinigallinarum]
MEENTTTSAPTAPENPRRRAPRKNRYQEFERYATYYLLGDAALFLLYLLFAGLGVVWLKVFLAIVAILASALGIGYLYITGELLRPRSLWMGTALAAIILCVLTSLILNYPSPNPYKDKDASSPSEPSISAPASGTAVARYTISDSCQI